MSPIEHALTRSAYYRFLAQGYRLLDKQGLDEWKASGAALSAAAEALEQLDLTACRPLLLSIEQAALEDVSSAHRETFGHTIQGSCPPYEEEYGPEVLDFRQCLELSDLAGFYRAFGLKMSATFGDRPDHVVAELEFMAFLAFKEAAALADAAPADAVESCRDGQRRFLEEHLGRWIPAFAARVEKHAPPGILPSLAEITRKFVLQECARIGVPAGDSDLPLRALAVPADQDVTGCESPEKAFVPLTAISGRPSVASS